jgi:hypothetical protein
VLASEFSARAVSLASLSSARHLLWSVRRVDVGRYKVKKSSRFYPIFGEYDRKPEKTAKCFLVPKTRNGTVVIEYDYENNKARYGGLQTCTSVWACPVHSWQISKGRRDELVKAAAIMEQDYYSLHAVFTMSHSINDMLYHSLPALLSALQRFRSGKAWKDFRARVGYAFDVQALEATYGFSNGWHPHKHWLPFFHKKIVDQLTFQDQNTGVEIYGIEALRAIFDDFATKRWMDVLVKDGRGFSASEERGVVVKNTESGITDYIAKFGTLPKKYRIEDEVARGHIKSGRSTKKNPRFTPFQLLEEYTFQSADWAGQVWLDYALAFKSKQQLRYSRGFKPFLSENGLDILTDEQLIEEAEYSPLFAPLLMLETPQWRQLIGEGLFAMYLDVIEVYFGDVDKCRQWLVDQGVDLSVNV